MTTSIGITSPQPKDKEKDIILVIEDNAMSRLQIKRSLSPDFTIIEAVNGKEGIIKARDFIPDLVVSDIMMPKINGFEVCRTLKNDLLTSHIPIILLTGRISEESILKGLEIGADDYITKPFSLSLLAARVKNLVALRRQLQLERFNLSEFSPQRMDVSPLDEVFYNKLLFTIESHLPDPDFNVDALCRLLKMSQSSLYRKVHGITGYSPSQFIRSYRLKRAAQLLESNRGSISEVALQVGFNNLSYFSRCFKKQFHTFPSDSLHSLQYEEEQISPTGNPGNDNDIEPADELPGNHQSNQDNILLIEGNDIIRKNLGRTLSTHYQVIEANSGNAGITRALETIPDLVICDTSTPENENLQVCLQLKSSIYTSHIPIILLASRPSEELIIRALELGVDDYLIKPFNSRVLHARVKNLIERRYMLQLRRHREMTLMPAKINESPAEKEFSVDLDNIMKRHHINPDFSVEELAEKLYMSSASLYRKIKAITGESPTDYLRNYRLKRAAKLLLDQSSSVTHVALEVGFKNLTHFSRCFKEKFHQLPSAYARSKALTRK